MSDRTIENFRRMLGKVPAAEISDQVLTTAVLAVVWQGADSPVLIHAELTDGARLDTDLLARIDDSLSRLKGQRRVNLVDGRWAPNLKKKRED